MVIIDALFLDGSIDKAETREMPILRVSISHSPFLSVHASNTLSSWIPTANASEWNTKR